MGHSVFCHQIETEIGVLVYSSDIAHPLTDMPVAAAPHLFVERHSYYRGYSRECRYSGVIFVVAVFSLDYSSDTVRVKALKIDECLVIVGILNAYPLHTVKAVTAVAVTQVGDGKRHRYNYDRKYKRWDCARTSQERRKTRGIGLRNSITAVIFSRIRIAGFVFRNTVALLEESADIGETGHTEHQTGHYAELEYRILPVIYITHIVLQIDKLGKHHNEYSYRGYDVLRQLLGL